MESAGWPGSVSPATGLRVGQRFTGPGYRSRATQESLGGLGSGFLEVPSELVGYYEGLRPPPARQESETQRSRREDL